MSVRRWSALAALVLLSPLMLSAQSGPGGGGGTPGAGQGPSGPRLTPEQREQMREQAREQRRDERQAGGGPGGPGGRPLLEQAIRERFASVVRNQLKLDDRQMRQLGDVSRRFEGRRRDLNQRERSAREVLRAEVTADKSGDNPRVATALQEVMAIQKERVGILEEEDKELAGFLSPVQRARWFALQDQLRRRVEEMRRRAAEGGEPAGTAPPEPPDAP